MELIEFASPGEDRIHRMDRMLPSVIQRILFILSRHVAKRASGAVGGAYPQVG
jgi:hypothetical protein